MMVKLKVYEEGRSSVTQGGPVRQGVEWGGSPWTLPTGRWQRPASKCTIWTCFRFSHGNFFFLPDPSPQLNTTSKASFNHKFFCKWDSFVWIMDSISETNRISSPKNMTETERRALDIDWTWNWGFKIKLPRSQGARRETDLWAWGYLCIPST